MRKNDIDTQQHIRKAAAALFLEKGFDGTSIRDIAEKADTNVALLNYYFRSKQRLYDMIVKDYFDQAFAPALKIFDEEGLNMNQTMERIVDEYTEFFLKHTDLPVFILNEMNRKPKSSLHIPIEELSKTRFVAQLPEGMKEEIGGVPYYVHMLINALSMLVFPVFLKPIFAESRQLDRKQFLDLVNARKQMLPIWLNTMIEMV